jgi:Tol biopolymer transport system component
VSDDFRYPDIAQEAGVVAAAGAAPATGPDQVVQSSPSEDQGLSWSPNGRWIAFHSHQQGSDDIWLRPSDRPEPLTRISTLGRGSEVGWPRWSPNGRWIVFDGDSGSGSRPWIVGVDQETGRVTQATRLVPLTGFQDNVIHAEWLGSSEELVFSAAEPSGVHTLYRVARTGGSPRPIHSYTTTQLVDGFGVSPDGSWLVFPQPDANGRLQLFRVDTAAGARPKQLTSDSTDKTQPAVSPDGRRIAFTAWRYEVRFWLLAK